MNYYQLVIPAKAPKKELLVFFLGQLGFSGFEEKPGKVFAYISAEKYDETLFIQCLSKVFKNIPPYQKKYLKDQNWNLNWERSFQPVKISGRVLIRATFHKDVPACPIEIIIDPRMAFGTGHHPTTVLMIESCLELDFKNKTVLDYGTGTGVLAILANKLGAGNITAIDIDPVSVQNAKNNAGLNNCRNIKVKQEDLGKFGDAPRFDIILANITRNVVLKSLPMIKKILKYEGTLVASGFFIDDRARMVEHTEKSGLAIQKITRKNNWLALCIVKDLSR